MLDGNYEGDVSFAKLGAQGDFGLGTFEALDDEMIGLDGDFYQIKSNGRAYKVDKRMKTPFAVVTFFEPRETREISAPTDYAALHALLNEVVAGDAETCHAVRVDGYFSYVRHTACPDRESPTRPSSKR